MIHTFIHLFTDKPILVMVNLFQAIRHWPCSQTLPLIIYSLSITDVRSLSVSEQGCWLTNYPFLHRRTNCIFTNVGRHCSIWYCTSLDFFFRNVRQTKVSMLLNFSSWPLHPNIMTPRQVLLALVLAFDMAFLISLGVAVSFSTALCYITELFVILSAYRTLYPL